LLVLWALILICRQNTIFMKKIYAVGLLILFPVLIHAQGDVNKLVDRADKYFKIKNYSEALSSYLEAVKAGADGVEVNYAIAKSYKEQVDINQRIKSIAYFEKSKGISPVPRNFHLDIGEVYHENGQVIEAMAAFEAHKKGIDPRDKASLRKIDRKIAISKNALKLLAQARDFDIQLMGGQINTEYTEYNPVVSADESVIAYTALRPNDGKTRSGEKLIEEIYVVYNENGTLSIPKKVEVKSNYNSGTAGMSSDGQQMMIFIGGANNTGNLYTIDKQGENWTAPTTIGTPINNLNYLESTASITPDGKVMYFASDRKGGYGGLDIYRSDKGEDGKWGTPKNLGSKVNSAFDEDAPFIHPDQRLLFFTSDGHNTIGGRDIFKTQLVNDEWIKPMNMGYPINTTVNDNYFTLTADGRKGYFSSDRKGGLGGQDIYTFVMPEDAGTIPLTMLKGKILDAETNKALPTKIYMIDNETKEKLDFVYHPDPETGSYLIIVPPNKNYDMIIESEGFLPYTLNIDIPNQTYFYELYQQIYLKTISQFDVVVGQQVEVKNAFYDTHEDRVADVRKAHEAGLVQNDSIDVYDLMNDLIAADDQSGIDYLLELIEHTNPVESMDFSKIDKDKMQAAKRVYYYDESDESKFEKKVIDGNTILSLPTMYVTEEALKQKNQQQTQSAVDPSIFDKIVKIYFTAGKSNLDPSYSSSLNQVLTVLKANSGLGVEISGFASSEGEEEKNNQLSNERAKNVLAFLNTQGIVRRRIVAKGYGETKGVSISSEEDRRVEVKIVSL